MTFLEIIEDNKNKFLKYNDIKFQRFQSLFLNNTVKSVINSIPYLLSVNHEKLPGYTEGETPMGISGYGPDEDTRRFIRAKFPAVRAELIKKDQFIEMLAVMGSVGSLAYNKKSDFDYWVCVNQKRISPDMLQRFKKKVEGVQNWATAEAKTSVHLFINDVEHIKENIYAEDDEEAFGTTIGAVLRDEFFRSSIIVAGKIPFWWVLPRSVRDAEYDEFFRKLPQEMSQNEFVDLGNLYEISREDFLGAALFQIIKSLGNPFKSIIKIGVLEKYLFGSDDSPLLSQKLKTNILAKNYDNNIIDSYLLMFNEVYDYYSSAMDDKEFMDILKMNLYLKINPQISRYVGIKDKDNIPYKVGIMARYTNRWNWNLDFIRDLDNFDNWDFNKIMKFWETVKKFMLLTYQRISAQLPKMDVKDKISESDFTLLSRKIKTHFRKEKDKIEQLITFKETPGEPVIYIEPAGRDVEGSEWVLYKSSISDSNVLSKTILRIEEDILRLLVWTTLNRIYEPVYSRLNIQSGYKRINPDMSIDLMNNISEFFKGERVYIKNEFYLHPEFKLLNLIILNFNISGAEEISQISYLFQTSWGESFLKEYGSEEDLGEILFDVLTGGLKLKRKFDIYCKVFSHEPYKKLYKKYILMFKRAYADIVENRSDRSFRFITSIGNKLVQFTKDGNKISKNTFPGIDKLLLSAALTPRKKIRYRFFGEEKMISSLDVVYRSSRENAITVVYEERGDRIAAYIINESGNIFVFSRFISLKEQFLIYLYDFCMNITKRINEGDDSPVFKMIYDREFKMYQVQYDRFGKPQVFDRTNSMKNEYVLKFRGDSAMIAYISKYMSDKTFYNIVFPDRVESGYMSINEIYSVPEKMRDMQSGGMDIYNIIRDIVFNDLKEKDKELGSTIYFLEKYKLELMIEKAAVAGKPA